MIGPDGTVRSPCDGILATDRKRLRVTPVFDVPASVDFSTGNIDFAGSVHVRGDVRDRFRLDIGENLIVDGVIEAASVRCKGGLHARTGMAARGLGRILVREDVEAGYLNAVSGAVEGSLTVHREVRNCTLTIGGGAPGCIGSSNGGECFQGALDDLRIYRAARGSFFGNLQNAACVRRALLHFGADTLTDFGIADRQNHAEIADHFPLPELQVKIRLISHLSEYSKTTLGQLKFIFDFLAIPEH